MCTGFINRGEDLVFGFNLDIDPAVWDFRIVKNKKVFTVAIKVGKTLYYTHGVNCDGSFSTLPYMNDCLNRATAGRNGKERIDLLTDRYLRQKYSLAHVLDILERKEIVNVPGNSLHTLMANKMGYALIIEPGLGHKICQNRFEVISNYPLLTEVSHFEPWFGKERFDKATEALLKTPNLSAIEGLELLKSVSQSGQWATRLSFTYSVKENKVYFVTNRQFDNIQIHSF